MSPSLAVVGFQIQDQSFKENNVPDRSIVRSNLLIRSGERQTICFPEWDEFSYFVMSADDHILIVDVYV